LTFQTLKAALDKAASYSNPALTMADATETALPPPFINIPTLPNLRSVSGLPCTNGTIRPHILYRAADPSNVSVDGVARLNKELGIRKIFDLRSKPEQDKLPGSIETWEKTIAEYNARGEGTIEREWTPVFREEDYSPEKIAVRYREYARSGSEVSFPLSAFPLKPLFFSRIASRCPFPFLPHPSLPSFLMRTMNHSQF